MGERVKPNYEKTRPFSFSCIPSFVDEPTSRGTIDMAAAKRGFGRSQYFIYLTIKDMIKLIKEDKIKKFEIADYKKSIMILIDSTRSTSFKRELESLLAELNKEVESGKKK